MTNEDFPNNLGIKCNKKEAYKFIEWSKANDFRFIYNKTTNTPENPWNFNRIEGDFIYYYIGNFLFYSDKTIDKFEYITFIEFVIKHKLFFIKGKELNTDYNLKIINCLEALGGENYYKLSGYVDNAKNAFYYIDNNNIIKCVNSSSKKYIEITLEELTNYLKMKETKEIKIEIPSGYEIDTEKSTFTNIVFKPIQLTYGEIAKSLFKNNKKVYYVDNCGDVNMFECGADCCRLKNNATSKKQGEKLLAINMLMNVATYLNEGWTPDWKDTSLSKFYIYIDSKNKLCINDVSVANHAIVYFKFKELAEQAIEILGEETIRIALCTDW